MAKPIPPLVVPSPVPAGDPAGTCWGPDKAFGDLETPESVIVVFSGINKGPNWYVGAGEPPNGTYVIPQFATDANIFRLFTGPTLTMSFGAAVTSLSGRVTATGDFFFKADRAGQCFIKFDNEENDIFKDGTGYIYIPKALL